MKWTLWMVVTAAALAAGVSPAAAQSAGASAGGKHLSYFDWFIHGGSWVGYILIVLSVASAALIIENLLSIRRSVILPADVRSKITALLKTRQLRELIVYVSGQRSVLGYVMSRALREANNGYAAMDLALQHALAERVSKLSLKPEVLSILGNTGPLIGLYGTVLGIILAFSEIVNKGGIPEPGDLAGSIGVALVATFWGLTVAIPSLVAYAVMKNRVESYSNEILTICREYLAVLRAAPRKSPEPAVPQKSPVASAV